MSDSDYLTIKAPLDPWDNLWFDVCKNCGSVVFNKTDHDNWHADGSR